MKIREVTVIQRTPAEVWPWIAIPERFLQWNTNIVSMEAREKFILQQPFNSHYQLRGKPLQCLSTVTAIEENHVLELKHTNCIGPDVDSNIEVSERITLEEKGNHTEVVRTITVRNHHVPLIALPLIWFVSRFGKPTEPSRLKCLCEGHEIQVEIEGPLPEGGMHEREHTPGARFGTFRKAQSFSYSGMLLPLAVIISFGWMLANAINPISAAIVRFNAQGYRQAVFTVEKLHHEDRRRTCLEWGFSGTINGVRERFYAPELAQDAFMSYLALGKRFPPGTKLDVLYNPDVTRDLFQGRTIRVLPHKLDFVAAEDRRIFWWFKFCLTPFVLITVIASKLQKRKV